MQAHQAKLTRDESLQNLLLVKDTTVQQLQTRLTELSYSSTLVNLRVEFRRAQNAAYAKGFAHWELFSHEICIFEEQLQTFIQRFSQGRNDLKHAQLEKQELYTSISGLRMTLACRKAELEGKKASASTGWKVLVARLHVWSFRCNYCSLLATENNRLI